MRFRAGIIRIVLMLMMDIVHVPVVVCHAAMGM